MTLETWTPDYAKFIYRGEVDWCLHRRQLLTAAYAAVRRGYGEYAGHYRVTPLPPHGDMPAGEAWECWGQPSVFVYGLSWRDWAKYLVRFDVQRELEGIDSLGLDVLYERAMAGPAQTLHRYRSPKRQKRNGRDAGGDTLAIGSHKSDLRVSWYKRGQEATRWEFQMKGPMLAGIVESADMDEVDRVGDPGMWQDLANRVAHWGIDRVRKALGCPWHEAYKEARDAAIDMAQMALTEAGVVWGRDTGDGPMGLDA